MGGLQNAAASIAHDEPRRRVDPAELAAALGAEPQGEYVGEKLDPISLAEIGFSFRMGSERLRNSTWMLFFQTHLPALFAYEYQTLVKVCTLRWYLGRTVLWEFSARKRG